jgi:bifunctional DNA-binding transcriptional regulator/antitoxin component of YhaV-PrlF toxin-antitoxin module
MPRTFATSKLSRSGQTVIPKRVRYLLGLTEGCTIRYERDGAGMKISGFEAKTIHPPLTIPPNPSSTLAPLTLPELNSVTG